MLPEVWSRESQGGAFYSAEVYRHRASELVRYQSILRGFAVKRSLGRKQILDSKSYKRLQELNLVLDKQALALDNERATLAKALQDYSAGMILERALHELCTELTELEAQDVTLRQQIIQETQKLNQLEQKVGQTSHCCFGLLILPDADRTHLSWRRSGA